jgi:hypothetical protein
MGLPCAPSMAAWCGLRRCPGTRLAAGVPDPGRSTKRHPEFRIHVYPSQKRRFAISSDYVFVNVKLWLEFGPLPLLALLIVYLFWAGQGVRPPGAAAPDSPFLLVEEPALVDFRLNR